jgi:ADP-heptose:LPS heptosyltransferase
MADPEMKVLVLRPRFLGDVILATGLAEAVHDSHPLAEVWFLVEDTFAEILNHQPYVRGVLAMDSKRKDDLFYFLGLLKKIRDQKFDIILDLFGNPRTTQMAFFSGAAKRVGFERRGRSWAYNVIAKPSSDPMPSGRRTVIDTYLDQLRAAGLGNGRSYKTLLQVSEDEKAHAKRLLERIRLKAGEKLAVLAPGASWPAKHWPLERFLELGYHLQGQGVRPLYVFGPKDEEWAQAFEPQMNKDWIYVNQPSLRGLMAFIEAADVLISNDAGPMHVGPAVGTPTLSIFGPGEPEIWFPYPKPHGVAYAEVPCSHCGLDHCPLMACMDRLDARQVADRVLGMLKS